MPTRTLIAFVLLTVAGMAQPAKPAQSASSTSEIIVLRGARLLTVSHGVIEKGALVMQNGRIAAIGAASTAIPSGAKVIDETGMTVYPGLIDAETHLGLTEVQADRMTNDMSEPSDEIMP